jgi:hypothetical protein
MMSKVPKKMEYIRMKDDISKAAEILAKEDSSEDEELEATLGLMVAAIGSLIDIADSLNSLSMDGS